MLAISNIYLKFYGNSAIELNGILKTDVLKSRCFGIWLPKKGGAISCLLNLPLKVHFLKIQYSSTQLKFGLLQFVRN